MRNCSNARSQHLLAGYDGEKPLTFAQDGAPLVGGSLIGVGHLASRGA